MKSAIHVRRLLGMIGAGLFFFNFQLVLPKFPLPIEGEGWGEGGLIQKLKYYSSPLRGPRARHIHEQSLVESKGPIYFLPRE